MKTTVKLLLSALSAVALCSWAGNASAQSISYQAVGDDGIAASPKLRQQLNDRKTSGSAATSDRVVSYQAVGSDGLAASPKARQQLNDRNASGSTATSDHAVSYQAVGSDGIAASPKLRQMLNDQGTRFQVAPVK